MTSLVIEKLDVAYGARQILSNIDLQVSTGEIVCLVGASGCGKSTLLNAVAGLVPARSGSVSVDGEPVTGPGADRVMVFQDDAVFPWMTVEQNVRFGLDVQGMPAKEQAEIVREVLGKVDLHDVEKHFPRELSGGMRKRVDLARAMAVRPKIILMDEPYGALDAMTKERLQVQFLKLCEEIGATSLFVTHDLEEALFLGDRIVVLGRNPGHVATVVDVPFDHPRDVSLKRTPEFQRLRGDLNDLIH